MGSGSEQTDQRTPMTILVPTMLILRRTIRVGGPTGGESRVGRSSVACCKGRSWNTKLAAVINFFTFTDSSIGLLTPRGAAVWSTDSSIEQMNNSIKCEVMVIVVDPTLRATGHNCADRRKCPTDAVGEESESQKDHQSRPPRRVRYGGDRSEGTLRRQPRATCEKCSQTGR